MSTYFISSASKPFFFIPNTDGRPSYYNFRQSTISPTAAAQFRLLFTVANFECGPNHDSRSTERRLQELFEQEFVCIQLEISMRMHGIERRVVNCARLKFRDKLLCIVAVGLQYRTTKFQTYYYVTFLKMFIFTLRIYILY